MEPHQKPRALSTLRRTRLVLAGECWSSKPCQRQALQPHWWQNNLPVSSPSRQRPHRSADVVRISLAAVLPSPPTNRPTGCSSADVIITVGYDPVEVGHRCGTAKANEDHPLRCSADNTLDKNCYSPYVVTDWRYRPDLHPDATASAAPKNRAFVGNPRNGLPASTQVAWRSLRSGARLSIRLRLVNERSFPR